MDLVAVERFHSSGCPRTREAPGRLLEERMQSALIAYKSSNDWMQVGIAELAGVQSHDMGISQTEKLFEILEMSYIVYN
jgi:hypothetical protein